jgi:hypothetical protein
LPRAVFWDLEMHMGLICGSIFQREDHEQENLIF